jgi:hypothetical protein
LPSLFIVIIGPVMLHIIDTMRASGM